MYGNILTEKWTEIYYDILQGYVEEHISSFRNHQKTLTRHFKAEIERMNEEIQQVSLHDVMN